MANKRHKPEKSLSPDDIIMRKGSEISLFDTKAMKERRYHIGTLD